MDDGTGTEISDCEKRTGSMSKSLEFGAGIVDCSSMFHPLFFFSCLSNKSLFGIPILSVCVCVCVRASLLLVHGCETNRSIPLSV